MMFPPAEDRPRVRGFEVLDRLGAGGVGSVYLARSKAGRLVAIKMLGDPKAELDQVQKRSLEREASLSARLVHPSIVQVRAFVQDAGYAALVFEYIEGVALARLLRFLSSQRVRLTDDAAFCIIARVLSALAYAHGHRDEGGVLVPIIHRDVSPSNVLLDWEGNTKLTDFGMAKMLGTSSGTRVGLVEGTLGCMAPEQARGDSVNERADVYAVALLAWRLATGISPFGQFRDDEVELLRAMRNPRVPSLAALRPDLPKRVLDAIARALVPDPEERRITAGEFSKIISEEMDVGYGHLELRAILTQSRAKLEEMVASGGVEQTHSIKDAGAGNTMRYEEVALAFDEDPYPESVYDSQVASGPGSEANGEPGAKEDDKARAKRRSLTALEPIAVEVTEELPTKQFAYAEIPRDALPSLDELILLSEITTDTRPPGRTRKPGSAPGASALRSSLVPGAGAIDPAVLEAVTVRRSVEAETEARALARAGARRWLLTFTGLMVVLLGVGVGAFLAWLTLRGR